MTARVRVRLIRELALKECAEQNSLWGQAAFLITRLLLKALHLGGIIAQRFWKTSCCAGRLEAVIPVQKFPGRTDKHLACVLAQRRETTAHMGGRKGLDAVRKSG